MIYVLFIWLAGAAGPVVHGEYSDPLVCEGVAVQEKAKHPEGMTAACISRWVNKET